MDGLQREPPIMRVHFLDLVVQRAKTNLPTAGKRGDKMSEYEELTEGELQEWAREISIEVRSRMDKDKLIGALRNH
jgi:hypothetical protein